MKREVSTDPVFRLLGNPETWMKFDPSVFDYAVLPDESGIIQAVPMSTAPDERIRLSVTVNFFDQLKRMAPHPD